MANTLIYTGRLASAPAISYPSGADGVCKFTLMRNESRGKDEQGVKREDRVVDIQFTAFRGMAETIAKNCFEGDQLEVTARIERNRYVDGNQVERFDYNFIVENFEFGAPGKKKRAMLDARQQPGGGGE